jgi:hypothetical protein
MTQTPRPLPRQPIRRSLEALTKKPKDILTLTGAFDAHLKDAWEFAPLGQKELLALQEHARTRRQPWETYYVVRVSSR